MTANSRAHIAVLMTNVFFAANFSLVKYISPSLVGPYGLNILRVSISLSLFWLLWLWSRGPAGIQRKHIWRFFLCGLTGIAINQMLFIKGLTMTSTIHASLLMLCTPLLITLSAFWVLREKITLKKIFGLSLGISGAAMLILSKEHTGSSGSSWQGDVLIVINAISYTIYFIIVKPLMKVYQPLHVIRWAFTFGMIIILPFGWQQFQAVQWNLFEGTHWAALLSVVIAGTFLAYLFNVYGIRHLGAGVAGSYIYTQPVFAALVATFFLGETFTLEKIISGVLIFTGVYLVGRQAVPVIQE